MSARVRRASSTDSERERSIDQSNTSSLWEPLSGYEFPAEMPLQSAQPVQLKASKSNAIPVATGQFATSARAAAAATRHLQTHSAPKQATAPIAQRYAKSVAESLSQPAVPNVKTQPAQSSRLVDSDGESRLARAHASLDADFAAALQSVRSQLDKSRHDLSQRLSQLTVGKRSASSIQDDDERMDQMFEEAEKALSHANSVADAALQTSARLKTLHAQSEQLEADSATAINSAPSSPSHASAFTSVSNATSPAHVQHKTQLSSSNLFGDHKAQSLTHRPVATISEAVVGSNDFEAIHDDIGTELDRIRPPYANRMLSNSSIASTDASSSDEATSRSANAFASNCKPSQNDEQKIVKSISRGTSHLSIVLPTEPAAAPLPSPGIDMSKHIPEPAPPAGFGVPAAIAALRQVHMTPMSPKSASALVFLRASSPAHLAASMTPHRRSTSPAGFGIMRPPSPYAGASPLAKRYPASALAYSDAIYSTTAPHLTQINMRPMSPLSLSHLTFLRAASPSLNGRSSAQLHDVYRPLTPTMSPFPMSPLPMSPTPFAPHPSPSGFHSAWHALAPAARSSTTASPALQSSPDGTLDSFVVASSPQLPPRPPSRGPLEVPSPKHTSISTRTTHSGGRGLRVSNVALTLSPLHRQHEEQTDSNESSDESSDENSDEIAGEIADETSEAVQDGVPENADRSE